MNLFTKYPKIVTNLKDSITNMDFNKLEKKWQKKWEKDKVNSFNFDNIDNKLYSMEMFSYPSGANLHLGHWFNFGLADSWARFKRMQGYEVFHPMGFDSFGLPAENYAIKTNTHPSIKTYESINTMRKQLKEMGGMIDWEYEIITSDENYYKWTQWIFVQLYKKGLAYKKEAPVNWCPSCKTVLANEQASGGKCERCNTLVIQKNMNQWFLKITDYAEELLNGLDNLDWPDVTKTQQKNWIGKSEGAEVKFKIENSKKTFDVFTTRPDTLFGATYVVLAPEHELVLDITTDEQLNTVKEYIKKTSLITEIDRQSEELEKTGAWTGAYAINPVNNKKIPIWISDYVLSTYGTGAIMAVPAHDERDYLFAKKYKLDIIEVVSGGNIEKEAYTGDGILVNSEFLNGLNITKAKDKIIEFLEKNKTGIKKTTYKLRDWLISRQRYWGAPIPIIYCEQCGTVVLEEDDLPVRLPENVKFMPNGKSPLAESEEFLNTTCPKCSKKATRETDTMDTFMCSSWYQLRYPFAKNNDEAFNREILNKIMPVDKYVGGKEHICLHLIYSRFVTKALRDCELLDFDEPFQSLVHQGTILGPDGTKMSKSRGNTISPDSYIKQYGSDTFRSYLMFGFNYIDGGPWSDEGIKAMSKFINKFINTFEQSTSITKYNDIYEEPEKELLYILNYTIKFVTEGFERFQFNTPISKIMVLNDAILKYLKTGRNSTILKDCIKTFVQLMAPAAPHITDELWSRLGNNESIFRSNWPTWDEKMLIRDTFELPVQINGKVKRVIEVETDLEEKEIIILAKNNIQDFIKDKQVIKEIYVPKKILNFIVK